MGRVRSRKRGPEPSRRDKNLRRIIAVERREASAPSPKGPRQCGAGGEVARAAYAGRLSCSAAGRTPVVRLSALRLPSFRMIPKSAVAVFGQDHAGKGRREGLSYRGVTIARAQRRAARTGKPCRHPEVAAQRPSKDAAQALGPSSFRGSPRSSRGSHLRMTGSTKEKAQCTATNDAWASAAFPAG